MPPRLNDVSGPVDTSCGGVISPIHVGAEVTHRTAVAQAFSVSAEVLAGWRRHLGGDTPLDATLNERAHLVHRPHADGREIEDLVLVGLSAGNTHAPVFKPACTSEATQPFYVAVYYNSSMTIF